MDRFTKKAAAAIGQALEMAAAMGHTYIGSEHLLLGILRQGDGIGARICLAAGVTFEKAEKKVRALIGTARPVFLSSADMTPRARRIVSAAFSAAHRFGQAQVGSEHLLYAMLRENGCTASVILKKCGADPAVLRDTTEDRLRAGEPDRGGRRLPKTLAKYGVDLCALARAGKVDPLIGREQEMERMMSVLGRRRKNNPCLIGPPGVGKTVMAEGLADRIVKGGVPAGLRGKTVYTLQLNNMVAGSKYRGEFEERLKNIVEECEKDPDILLFIDEIHTLIGAGAAEGAVDAANILKPALSRGRIRVIGATTPEEYRRHIEKDAALERRLAPVILREATAEQTAEILKGARAGLEAHHGVIIENDALSAAVELSERYIHDRFQPDKALDLLDEAAARLVLTCEQTDDRAAFEAAVTDGRVDLWLGERRSPAKPRLTRADIAAVVSRWTGIPAGICDEEENDRLRDLEKTLGRSVYGQEESLAALAAAIRGARLGLTDPERPYGCFLFAGPTGVGKSFVCKALARAVYGTEKSLIRFDMSEYMEKHAASRLIGAPPGYVGHDDGGTLIKAVRADPYSVILFDEAEKAHPDVLGLLLQIMEEGTLTGSDGRRADFRNAVIVLTTNVGARLTDGVSIGFAGEGRADKRRLDDLLRKRFSPELINRLDEIVLFHRLTAPALERIAKGYLEEIARRLDAKGYRVSFGEDVAAWIAGCPDTDRYGARPLRRFVRHRIERPLGDLILDGALTPGTPTAADRAFLEAAASRSYALNGIGTLKGPLV